MAVTASRAFTCCNHNLFFFPNTGINLNPTPIKDMVWKYSPDDWIDAISIDYEAWMIYNFLSLCLAWVGVPGAVVLSLSGRVLKPSWCLITCCFPAIPLDGRFMRRCKQGCLQFVILKPILVAVTLILYARGKYEDGNFSPNQSIFVSQHHLYNIIHNGALCLGFILRGLQRSASAIQSGSKVYHNQICCFLNLLAGVLVFLPAKSRFIKDAGEAAEFQNFIICVEMLIAAVGHLYAFPYKEYAGANIGISHGLTGSLAHALKLNEFYHDMVHQFALTHHDYVLYNHSEGDEGTRKYRSRTFVPTGQEMDTVRRNKHMFGSKLDDMQLSSESSGTSTTKNSTGHDPSYGYLKFFIHAI